jgi:hypothetical protein
VTRERYTPEGIPVINAKPDPRVRREQILAAKLGVADPVPYHSVGFFRKVWKIVSGF